MALVRKKLYKETYVRPGFSKVMGVLGLLVICSCVAHFCYYQDSAIAVALSFGMLLSIVPVVSSDEKVTVNDSQIVFKGGTFKETAEAFMISGYNPENQRVLIRQLNGNGHREIHYRELDSFLVDDSEFNKPSEGSE